MKYTFDVMDRLHLELFFIYNNNLLNSNVAYNRDITNSDTLNTYCTAQQNPFIHLSFILIFNINCLIKHCI